MKNLLYLLLAMTVVSCSNDDDNETTAPLARYNFGTMHNPQGTLNLSGNKVTLTYDGNKITKRVGGIVPMDPATGFSYAFSTNQYDEITYSDHKITVLTKNTFFTDPSKQTDIILDSQDRMSQKINVAQPSPGFQTSLDTMKYSYNSSGLLTQAKRGKLTQEHETVAYFYDSNKNLDHILTTHSHSTDVMYTIEETFSDYDTAANPLKKFFLFEETFLRSLSKNNYMHYERKKYDATHTLVEEEDQNWTIPHNANGQILFDAD